MAERTVIACDKCGGEPAQRFLVDLGLGDRQLDLCDGCAVEVALPRLMKFTDEHGAPVEAAPARSQPARTSYTKAPIQCPLCDHICPGRTAAIKHLVAAHGKDEVQASRLVPPVEGGHHSNGKRVECEVCGFLTLTGPGYAQHVTTRHGQRAWDKIKAVGQQ